MSEASESIIVCEGFHDRAFFKGWLLQRGWTGAKDVTYAPLGRKLTGAGQHGYSHGDGTWARIVPAGSDTQVLPMAEQHVARARTNLVARIVVQWDDDRDANTPASGDPRRQSFEAWARSRGATPEAGTLDFILPSPMQTRLSLIVWRVDAAPELHLPRQQTLERLVCKAIVATYGDRGSHIQSWLAGRRAPPDDAHGSAKSHAASHMAGWFAEHGSEDFYTALWSDPAIRLHLEADLALIGATRVLDLLEHP